MKTTALEKSKSEKLTKEPSYQHVSTPDKAEVLQVSTSQKIILYQTLDKKLYMVTPTGTSEKQVVTEVVLTGSTYTIPETFVQVDENLPKLLMTLCNTLMMEKWQLKMTH